MLIFRNYRKDKIRKIIYLITTNSIYTILYIIIINLQIKSFFLSYYRGKLFKYQLIPD